MVGGLLGAVLEGVEKCAAGTAVVVVTLETGSDMARVCLRGVDAQEPSFLSSAEGEGPLMDVLFSPLLTLCREDAEEAGGVG